MKIKKATAAVAALGLVLGMMATGTSQADTFGSGGNQFTIDFVNIGNAGNAADAIHSGQSVAYGAVSYDFRMGTYEISRDMITKANAASGNLGLTMADMSSYGGNGVDRPATGVTWNEAARFVNWLNTSSGYSAAYKFEFQPGEGSYSANSNILLWESGDAGYNASNPYRNSDAYYFLPSDDEWYKAAYYSGSGSTYYDYPTASDTAPTAVTGGTTSGTTVYSQSVAQGPADITDAGGLSFYGTMGQGGNVNEWLESAFTPPNDSPTDLRVSRGLGWNTTVVTQLGSSSRSGASEPTFETVLTGFRVASIPEPSTAGLILFGGAVYWLLRRKRD